MTNTWRHHSRTGWDQAGTDWDNGKPIEIWYRNQEYVVFKIPGGHHWGSILQPSVSHPGSYHVARIVEDQGDTLITEPLFDMPLSKRGGPPR